MTRYICANHGRLSSSDRVIWHDCGLKRWCRYCIEEMMDKHCAEITIEYGPDTIVDINEENEMRQDTISCIDRAYDDATSDLEKRIDACEQNYPSLWKHIQKLEDYMTMEDRITASEILMKLSVLEDKYNFILEQLPVYPKKPQECPVCRGKGNYKSVQHEPPYVLHNKCSSCEGNGIVWE